MSSFQYLDDKEIAAHESALQAVRDKRAAAEEGLRDEIERLQKELEERLAREVKVMHEKEEIELESLIVEQERRIVLRRIYHEAPNDIMELIVKLFSDVNEYGWGRGGLSVLRLVSKRLMRVVESCATRLTQLDYDGTESFPLTLRTCKRIEHITCWNRNLRSLDGCPDGLKSLYIGYGSHLQSLELLRGCTELESLDIMHAYQISDLNPLNACTKLKKLYLPYSQVTDISTLAAMSLLEEIELSKANHPSIKGLSPLSQCKRLEKLNIGGNRDIEDISPLARCTQIEMLDMSGLTKINDLKHLSSLTKLKVLHVSIIPVEDLTPLSALQDLEKFFCRNIPLTTSVLPLARCINLKKLVCNRNAKEIELLREKRNDIFLHF